jgi:hypothetical protein
MMKQKIHNRNPIDLGRSLNTVSRNKTGTVNSFNAPNSDINFSIQKKVDESVITEQTPASSITQLYAEVINPFSFQTNSTQLKSYSSPNNGINFIIQRKTNTTGLPENLKSGIENLSGYSLDDVKVHYNSSKPAQLSAHAYAQGSQIHIAPGQQKHLAHEAWHVVQQKQGRVKPTKQLKGKVNINDNTKLEKEADVMAKQIQNYKPIQGKFKNLTYLPSVTKIVQRVLFGTKADKKPLSEEEINALIARLVARYGASNRERIVELVNHYKDDKKPRSIRDVEDLVRANVRVDAARAVPLEFGAADAPMLPTGRTAMPVGDRAREPTAEERRTAIRHMEFNSVTFLTAKVFLSDGSTFVLELRNEDGRKNEGHAEMLLLAQIRERLSGQKGVGVSQITITINNSPCILCGPDLAKWAQENGNPRIVIHFTNAYGSTEEFVHSAAAMRGAGIHLHDFNPMDHVDAPTAREFSQTERGGLSIHDRFNRQAIAGRNRLADQSATEAKEQGASGSEEQRPHTAKRRGRSEEEASEEERRLHRRERPHAEISGRNYSPNVIGIRDGGECFWDTLRVRYGFTEQQLRDAARATGVIYEQHMFVDQIANFVQNLSRIIGRNIQIVLDEFDIFTLRYLNSRTYGAGDVIVHIGFFIDQEGGNGHFVPPNK